MLKNASEEVIALIGNKILDFTKKTISAIQKIEPHDGFNRAVLAISECDGRIILTGIGKAGHAARKATSTLCSLNIPSVYLHPGEASHGDSGIISKDDIVLAFSTSGKTREVIEVVQLAKKLGVTHTIAVTSHPNAPLRKICDITIDMGIIQEAGYLNIAPTTSITVMMVIADMLATIAAELRGVSMEDFALHHHSGYCGAKARQRSKRSSRR